MYLFLQHNNIPPPDFKDIISSEVLCKSLISDGSYYQVWKGQLVEEKRRHKSVIIKIDKGRKANHTHIDTHIHKHTHTHTHTHTQREREREREREKYRKRERERERKL